MMAEHDDPHKPRSAEDVLDLLVELPAQERRRLGQLLAARCAAGPSPFPGAAVVDEGWLALACRAAVLLERGQPIIESTLAEVEHLRATRQRKRETPEKTKETFRKIDAMKAVGVKWPLVARRVRMSESAARKLYYRGLERGWPRAAPQTDMGRP